jgi:PKD repeat protein
MVLGYDYSIARAYSMKVCDLGMMNKKTILLIFTSIFLSSTILSMYMMTSTSGIGEIIEPQYLEIADYYDNRKAVVTITADDWYASTWQQFEDMSKMLTEKRIYYTGDIITDFSVNWTQIQYWLNQGYAEAASHSRSHPPTVPYSDYDSEIDGSKQDILTNLALPPHFSYGSTEYVYTWIEPYGKSDSILRKKLGECKYLVDRMVCIDNDWATWDSANGLFDRIGFSIRMEIGYATDAATLKSMFDSVYSSGQIYHLFTHPRDVNWEPDQYADLHTSYISNRNDVWYVNFGLLYLYHWIDSQNVVQVTSTGSLQDKVFKITIPSADRQNYGAKYPVTYVFDIPPSWTNAYANYRFRETDPWTTMETKTSSDFFNGINAVRYDFANHKAYISIGFDDVSNDIYLQILPQDNQPTADFLTMHTSGLEPLTVSFTDTSTSYDGIVSWAWDFGDGETSAEQNPIHVYNEGVYTVSLTVWDTDVDNDTETKINFITVNDAEPVAGFTASPTSGAEPLTVSFTDLSSSYDNITAWEWDFNNDGVVDSMEQNSTYVYLQDGLYNVTLQVYEGDGNSDIETKVDYVNVADTEPIADFGATPTSGVEPLQVSFTDTSTSYDDIVSWSWDFGDGRFSTDQNPPHIYVDDGPYTVILTVTEDDEDSAMKTKEAYITVIDTNPSTNFTASPTSKALTVSFADTSTSYDEIVSWVWDFGDGQTSTEQNPTHKFPDDGTFNVRLTFTDVDGSKDTITKQVSVVNVAPTADFNIMSSPKPTVDEDITFLDQSSDPDGNIKLWFWDFGDGTHSTAQSVTHRYFALGTFIVNLTVTDDGGKTGAISKSLTIYDVLPPVTVDDYDGWGHTSDFTINLNATDDLSRVQTIYYIINGGSTMNVQAQGQPRISVEGHNKLEYWSVDFCGNEETHHVIQDIHLDKTSRPRAILVVAGITLAIGISAAGTILYARAKKEKEKNQTLRRS